MRSRVVLLLAMIATGAACRGPFQQGAVNNLPPAEMIMHPGPGVDGPGPGVLVPPAPMPAPVPVTSQVAFVGPEGVTVQWDVAMPGMFDSEPLIAPGRYNFPQGAIYRLKLTNVPGRPGVELYPTLEIGPAVPRTDAFLAHNAIPVAFTEEDFDQVLSGNFVTKVIYLPDPEYQELALAGVETLVSTRLDPGVDPIIEADQRGAILAIVRLGNKDLQVPGAAGMAPGMMPPGMMVPGMPCPPEGMGVTLGMNGVPMGNGCPPVPPPYVAGATAPQYGMPYSGTPIGLVGPPHVPLGVPAGLYQHSIHNWTPTHIPGPTETMKIDVRQSPGIHYPVPANRVHVTESAHFPNQANIAPVGTRHVMNGAGMMGAAGTCAPCPPTMMGGAPCPPGAAY